MFCEHAPTVSKKKMRLSPQNPCSERRDSLFVFRSEYSVCTQTEQKTKICFGLPKPSPSPRISKMNAPRVPFRWREEGIVRGKGREGGGGRERMKRESRMKDRVETSRGMEILITEVLTEIPTTYTSSRLLSEHTCEGNSHFKRLTYTGL